MEPRRVRASNHNLNKFSGCRVKPRRAQSRRRRVVQERSKQTTTNLGLGPTLRGPTLRGPPFGAGLAKVGQLRLAKVWWGQSRSQPAGQPSAGPPKISLFFSLSTAAYFILRLPLLGVLSWNLGGVCEAPAPKPQASGCCFGRFVFCVLCSVFCVGVGVVGVCWCFVLVLVLVLVLVPPVLHGVGFGLPGPPTPKRGKKE